MLRLTALTGLLLAAPLAWSADNGFYLGAGITQSDYGLGNPDDLAPFDDKDHGFKLIAGWRALDSFGVEVTYIDHGNATVPTGVVCAQFITDPCPVDTRLDAKSLSAFAVGYLDFPFVDLFAKAGVNSWKYDGHGIPSGSGFSFDDSGTDLAFGAGVQVRLRSLGARLEYERFNVIDNEHLDTVSLSVTWTFL